MLLLCSIAAILALSGPAHGEVAGADLRQALDAAGRVRVMVVLETPPPPAGGPAKNDVQRRVSIEAAQHALLSSTREEEFELIHRYETIPAVAGMLSRQGLRTLLDLPEVKRVDLDAPGGGELADSVPQIGADVLRDTYGLTGGGIRVAVLDTGMETDHPDLLDALAAEACFCSGGGGCCPGGAASRSGPGAAEDDHGHGTHVTSIVTGDGRVAPPGVAPGAEIVAIKVLDRNNRFCCSSDVVAGLDWILASRPDVAVVNLSLGTDAVFQGACDDATAFTMAYAAAIDALTERGVTVFAASGNSLRPNALKAPACVANAFAVGAVDESDQVFLLSNSGSALDLWAPGVNVLAATRGAGAFPASGTSQAVPHAAGGAALLLEAQSRLTPERILEAFREGGVPVLDLRNGLVRPRIDVAGAFQSLEACDDGLDDDGDGWVDVEDPDCPPVVIDVGPRAPFDFVPLFARAVVRIVLFGGLDLDAAEIEAASLALGPEGALPLHDLADPEIRSRHLRDVDGDGWTDLKVHYRAGGTGIPPGESEVCVTGSVQGEPFRACDDVIGVCPPRWSRRAGRRHGGGWGRWWFAPAPACFDHSQGAETPWDQPSGRPRVETPRRG